MGNIIFICIVLFLAVMTFAGYRRGLIRSVFSLGSFLIIFAVVSALTPAARRLCRNTPVYPAVRDKVEDYVEAHLSPESDEELAIGMGTNEQEKVINRLPLPRSVRQDLIERNTEEGYRQFKVSAFKEYLVVYLTDLIVNAASFLILLIVVTIAVRVVIRLLDIISRLPVLHFFNKGGGALFGLALAVMLLWIVCLILPAFSATQWGQRVFEAINAHALLSLIYNNNLLERWMFWNF